MQKASIEASRNSSNMKVGNLATPGTPQSSGRRSGQGTFVAHNNCKTMISVIVCTYNRSNLLQGTLNSLREMDSPGDLTWELIIVDNNSSDGTPVVARNFSKYSPVDVRYVVEHNQGISHARNRGVREAKGQILAFTDDDVIVDRYWLSNVAREFEKHNAACIGGKILPAWQTKPPAWLTRDLCGYLALLDYGEEDLYLSTPVLWGANMAVKALAFDKYGTFNTSLGRSPDKLYAGEETDFISRLLEAGESVVYSPNIVVHHIIPENRLRKRYFRKWVFDQGELKGIALGDYRFRNICGIPLYTFREIATYGAKYAKAVMFGDGNSFAQELGLMRIMGFMHGRLKYKWGRGSGVWKARIGDI